MKQKLFSIFCCLLLSASMVTQAQLLDAVNDSPEGGYVFDDNEQISGRNNAPMASSVTFGAPYVYAVGSSSDVVPCFKTTYSNNTGVFRISWFNNANNQGRFDFILNTSDVTCYRLNHDYYEFVNGPRPGTYNIYTGTSYSSNPGTFIGTTSKITKTSNIPTYCSFFVIGGTYYILYSGSLTIDYGQTGPYLRFSGKLQKLNSTTRTDYTITCSTALSSSDVADYTPSFSADYMEYGYDEGDSNCFLVQADKSSGGSATGYFSQFAIYAPPSHRDANGLPYSGFYRVLQKNVTTSSSTSPTRTIGEAYENDINLVQFYNSGLSSYYYPPLFSEMILCKDQYIRLRKPEGDLMVDYNGSYIGFQGEAGKKGTLTIHAGNDYPGVKDVTHQVHVANTSTDNYTSSNYLFTGSSANIDGYTFQISVPTSAGTTWTAEEFNVYNSTTYLKLNGTLIEIDDASGSVTTVSGKRIFDVTFVGTNREQYHLTNKPYITFLAEDGSTVLQEGYCNYNSTPLYSGSTPTKPEDASYTYTFSGWSPSITAATADKTYTAQFSASPKGPVTYALSWDANGGDLVGTAGEDYTPDGNYEAGTSIKVPHATREGYHLTEWDGDAVNSYAPDDCGTEQEKLDVDESYIARWTADTYNLTYEGLNGATNSNPETYTIETATFALANPGTREGYTFTGWTCGGTPITQIAVGSTGDKTITANWSVKSHTLTWNANGGSLEGGTAAGTTAYGTALTAPTATRTGYTFAGWDPSVPATMPDANATYTAQWNTVTYNLTYNGLEGATNNSNPATYTIETATFALANPGTREGYTFDGWTCGGDAITQIVQGSTGDKVITANWQVNSHAVAVVSNDVNYGTVSADAISNVKDGMAITVSENTLTLNGTTVTATAKAEDDLFTYAFDGWTDNAGNALPSTVSGELTIRANFTRSTKTSITLNESGTDEYYTAFKSEYWGTEGEKAKTVTATYNRTFTQGRWSTLCLPFNVNQSIMNTQKLKGSVYEFKYATGDADEGDNVVLYFKTANTMNAGQCYIVNANSTLAGRSSFVFNNVTINLANDNVASLTSADDYNSLRATPEVLTEGTIRLVGTLRKGTLKGDATGNTYMGLKDNKIWYPNTSVGNVILAYRGLFRSSEALNASRVRIVVEGETVTELEVVNGELKEAAEARKFVQDGILYIERDGVLYNAQGQKVGKVEN